MIAASIKKNETKLKVQKQKTNSKVTGENKQTSKDKAVTNSGETIKVETVKDKEEKPVKTNANAEYLFPSQNKNDIKPKTTKPTNASTSKTKKTAKSSPKLLTIEDLENLTQFIKDGTAGRCMSCDYVGCLDQKCPRCKDKELRPIIGAPKADENPDGDNFQDAHDEEQLDLNEFMDPVGEVKPELAFLDAVQKVEERLYYYDPSDDMSPKSRLTRAFHLSVDYESFVREKDVDNLLDNLPDDDLLGHHEPWDTRAFAIQTSANMKDASKIQPYLGYRPLEVVRRTLENTTQLAVQLCSTPMRTYVKSIIPFLNKPRLHETVGMDTQFASVRDVSGAWCSQVFWGLSSHMINVYGMIKESQGPDRADDFMREQGIPAVFRSDNSRMQRYGKNMLRRLRQLLVGAEYTEPYHPQQNPTEMRAIRWLKNAVKILRARTGAPATVWLQAMEYLADVHNVTADETLGWITPWQKRFGETPDISPFLQFQFYEKVLYRDSAEKFPETEEKAGYWLGVTKNVGHKLTYKILTNDTRQIIERSVVRSASEGLKPNKTVKFDPEMDPRTVREDDGKDEGDDLIIEGYKVPQTESKPAGIKKVKRNKVSIPNIDPPTELKDGHSLEDFKGKKDPFVPKNQEKPRVVPDRDKPKPENRDPPPEVRRTQRHRKAPSRLAFNARRLLMMMLPLTLPVMSTHEIHPMKDPNVVMTDEPEVGSRPSYELTGLSRFQAEQLQYVQMLDLTQERDNSDANDKIVRHEVSRK